MRWLVAILFILPIFCNAQKRVPFGGTAATDTAYAGRSILVDSNVRFLKYATSDTNRVAGFDALGNLVWRTKNTPANTLQQVTDAGATTTNTITANSLILTGVPAGDINDAFLVMHSDGTVGYGNDGNFYKYSSDSVLSTGYGTRRYIDSLVSASSGTPSLQQVTDVDSITTHHITAEGLNLYDDTIKLLETNSASVAFTNPNAAIQGVFRLIIPPFGFKENLAATLTANRTHSLPDRSGALVMSVNGIDPDNSTGNSIVGLNSVTSKDSNTANGIYIKIDNTYNRRTLFAIGDSYFQHQYDSIVFYDVVSKRLGMNQNLLYVSGGTVLKYSGCSRLSFKDSVSRFPTKTQSGDLLILGMGFNDARVNDGDTAAYRAGYELLLDTILHHKGWSGSDLIFVNSYYIPESHYTTQCGRTPPTHAIVKQYNYIIKTLAQKYNSIYADVWSLGANNNGDYWIQNNTLTSVHQLRLGHQMMGEYILSLINDKVKKNSQSLSANGVSEFEHLRIKGKDTAVGICTTIVIDSLGNIVTSPMAFVPNNYSSIPNNIQINTLWKIMSGGVGDITQPEDIQGSGILADSINLKNKLKFYNNNYTFNIAPSTLSTNRSVSFRDADGKVALCEDSVTYLATKNYLYLNYQPIGSYENALTFSTGITRTVNTITNNVSTGVSGGQTIYGGTAASNSLIISSTSNATKGFINFGNGGFYDETLNRYQVGITPPGLTANNIVQIFRGFKYGQQSSRLDIGCFNSTTALGQINIYAGTGTDTSTVGALSPSASSGLQINMLGHTSHTTNSTGGRFEITPTQTYSSGNSGTGFGISTCTNGTALLRYRVKGYGDGSVGFNINGLSPVYVGTDSAGYAANGSGKLFYINGTVGISAAANKSLGTATLSGGTVTVNNTSVTASSVIIVTGQNCSSCGAYSIGTITAGTSFVINSTNAGDASTVGYLIIN